jgi:hypothetical protein
VFVSDFYEYSTAERLAAGGRNGSRPPPAAKRRDAAVGYGRAV